MGNNLGYPDKSFFNDFRQKNIILTFPMINSVIAKYSSNGFLRLENFNECLKSIFPQNVFPQLAYTYLSERLFSLLDIRQSGVIKNEDLSKGLCLALSTQETRYNSIYIYIIL